ncbi:MAG: hypothetical protein JNL82_16145 [Myxococcales bacterium]|nr:hypothetical protein [Myxococcales bacterium]
MMMVDLNCYGDDIGRLAGQAGEFDLRSLADATAWYRREWQAIAETLGFAQQLAAMPTAIPTTNDRIAAMTATGLAALERALQVQRQAAGAEQARVQLAVLRQLVAGTRTSGELWRIAVDPTTLQTGACFSEGGRSQRAFYPDTAPGYFGDGWPGPPPRAESACGWTTPLVLHLGTFPWVYSTRLEATGPAMRWPTSGPILEGLQAAVSMLDPRTNLRQDARQVAAIYQHFITNTAPLVARVPVYQPGRAESGRLYRRGALLHVHQGSLHVAGLDGPRGRVAATAYNYVIRRFACFFAVRQAALRAFSALGSEVQQLARTSADPCLRQQVQEVARAG